MGFTISRRKQPVEGSFLKKGLTFYRVKSNGVYMQDFKTRMEAQRYITKLKK